MTLNTQRRMAASILDVGLGKVWFDPEESKTIASAVTREDMRRLVNQGVVQAKMEDGQSKYWTRFRRQQRAKGRRRGHGKRKGAKTARFPKKARWISTIRPLRRILGELKEAKKIDKATHRKLYVLMKSGMFKSKAHLETYLKENKVLKSGRN